MESAKAAQIYQLVPFLGMPGIMYMREIPPAKENAGQGRRSD
jgi:hypothetical protein